MKAQKSFCRERGIVRNVCQSLRNKYKRIKVKLCVTKNCYTMYKRENKEGKL